MDSCEEARGTMHVVVVMWEAKQGCVVGDAGVNLIRLTHTRVLCWVQILSDSVVDPNPNPK
jgi:hypothetical protein